MSRSILRWCESHVDQCRMAREEPDAAGREERGDIAITRGVFGEAMDDDHAGARVRSERCVKNERRIGNEISSHVGRDYKSCPYVFT